MDVTWYMMNFKTVGAGVFAIMVSALIFSLPIVGATQINILFDGDKKTETSINAEDMINQEIDSQD